MAFGANSLGINRFDSALNFTHTIPYHIRLIVIGLVWIQELLVNAMHYFHIGTIDKIFKTLPRTLTHNICFQSEVCIIQNIYIIFEKTKRKKKDKNQSRGFSLPSADPRSIPKTLICDAASVISFSTEPGSSAKRLITARNRSDMISSL